MVPSRVIASLNYSNSTNSHIPQPLKERGDLQSNLPSDVAGHSKTELLNYLKL